MSNPTLYDILGVAPDATAAAIKAAYEARSAAETHPDRGGQKEAFRAVQAAYDVLGVEARRRKYDATGEVEEDKPDTTRSAALGVIELAIAAVMNPYLNSGCAPDKDPRWRDIVAEIKASIRKEMHQAKCGIENGEHLVVFLRDMAERFNVAEGDNFLRASFLRQAEQNEKMVEGLRLNIKAGETALASVNSGRRSGTRPGRRRPAASTSRSARSSPAAAACRDTALIPCIF